MPVHTDVLAERIDKLVDQVEESNRLFNEFRVSMARDIGEIRAGIGKFEGRVETWLSFAKWAVGMIVLGFTLVGGLAISTARDAAKLDTKLIAYEKSVDSLRTAMEDLTRSMQGDKPRRVYGELPPSLRQSPSPKPLIEDPAHKGDVQDLVPIPKSDVRDLDPVPRTNNPKG